MISGFLFFSLHYWKYIYILQVFALTSTKEVHNFNNSINMIVQSFRNPVLLVFCHRTYYNVCNKFKIKGMKYMDFWEDIVIINVINYHLIVDNQCNDIVTRSQNASTSNPKITTYPTNKTENDICR